MMMWSNAPIHRSAKSLNPGYEQFGILLQVNWPCREDVQIGHIRAAGLQAHRNGADFLSSAPKPVLALTSWRGGRWERRGRYRRAARAAQSREHNRRFVLTVVLPSPESALVTRYHRRVSPVKQYRAT